MTTMIMTTMMITRLLSYMITMATRTKNGNGNDNKNDKNNYGDEKAMRRIVTRTTKQI